MATKFKGTRRLECNSLLGSTVIKGLSRINLHRECPHGHRNLVLRTPDMSILIFGSKVVHGSFQVNHRSNCLGNGT